MPIRAWSPTRPNDSSALASVLHGDPGGKPAAPVGSFGPLRQRSPICGSPAVRPGAAVPAAPAGCGSASRDEVRALEFQVGALRREAEALRAELPTRPAESAIASCLCIAEEKRGDGQRRGASPMPAVPPLSPGAAASPQRPLSRPRSVEPPMLPGPATRGPSQSPRRSPSPFPRHPLHQARAAVHVDRNTLSEPWKWERSPQQPDAAAACLAWGSRVPSAIPLQAAGRPSRVRSHREVASNHSPHPAVSATWRNDSEAGLASLRAWKPGPALEVGLSPSRSASPCRRKGTRTALSNASSMPMRTLFGCESRTPSPQPCSGARNEGGRGHGKRLFVEVHKNRSTERLLEIAS
mmetsp:Transcript_141492/g.368661  ORF Transcript_141492/g.368661 Transcript_141492/m.368661 type:complete len:352 (-) Transcript_141492:171-1226(-)